MSYYNRVVFGVVCRAALAIVAIGKGCSHAVQYGTGFSQSLDMLALRKSLPERQKAKLCKYRLRIISFMFAEYIAAALRRAEYDALENSSLWQL